MMRKWMSKKLIMLFALVLALVMNGMQWTGTVTVAKADSSYSAEFKYNGKTYTIASIEGTKAISLSDILGPLEITGSVTAADVSEDQGMTVTTDTLTMTKPFGSGWLKVTADGTEYQITITSTPNSITVVLYGTLRFDKNGGSGIMDGQSIREYSQTVLPDCTFTPPDGHTFDQWEIGGARYDAGATYFFGQTTTAKAIWKLRDGVHSITASYHPALGDVILTPTMAAGDEIVTVTVQPVAGKAVDSITYSYGSVSGQSLSGGEGGVYTFSMPEENTTVKVTFKNATKTPVPYINVNGSEENCSDYQYVRSNDTAWSGWMVVSQNLTFNRRIAVLGTVNLILMDGKTLTVTDGIQVSEGNTLNIYSQSENTGVLIAGNKQNSYAAGIGGNKGNYNAGTITINGGKITATGGYNSAGIGGASDYSPYIGNAGNITIRGNANVNATSGENGSGIGCGSGGIGGTIVISGNATVQAKVVDGYMGSGAAIGSGRGGYVNSITISGGTVIATGGTQGSAIGNGHSSSSENCGTISITGGNVTATATGGEGAGIGGMCTSITIDGNAVVHATGARDGAGIGGYKGKPGGNITIEGNANVTAVGGNNAAGIGTGSEATGEAVITITGGTVNATMSSSNGAAAIGSGYKAQGKTTVSISGGQVTASGSTIYGVGIGGGNTGAAGEEVTVNITGGTVRASGRAGIGTANESNAALTVNISGGTVIASGTIDSGNKGAAIGQGNNSNSATAIIIHGGVVKTLGTGYGIGAGAGSKQTPTINLGYTDATKDGIEITAIDYNGTVTLEKGFIYKDTKGNVSIPVTANKTIICAGATAHCHSFTYASDGKTITATCANSDTCNLSEQKATLTIGEPEGSMVYDGGAKAAALTGDTDVLIVDVEYRMGTTILPSAPSNVGNYTASITLGEATASVSYEITKRPVTFASITAKDKEYDGTTKANCYIGTGLNGSISGDNVYADVYTGDANFEDANAGFNKTVTFSNWKITGTAKDNYELIQPEPQYRTITPRVITITAKEQTVAKGGTVNSTPEQVEVTGGTLVEGQRIAEVTLTGDTSSITDSGTITASAVKILDASNGDMTANYYVNYTAGNLIVTDAPDHAHSFTYSASGATITATCADTENCQLTNQQAALTISAPSSVTYDGAAKAATITGDTAVLGTPSITYSGNGSTTYTASNTAPTNAGTYTAGFTLGEGDEAKTASVSYTIVPKSVIITGLTANDKVYDGTTAATATGTPTIYEKVGSDDVSVAAGSATFASANVGTQSVTFSAYSLAGTAADNYSLSGQPAETTAAITARPITIQADNQSVELNGTITYGVEKVNVSSDTKLVDGHNIATIVLTPSSTENATTSGSITLSAATILDASAQDVTANYSITYAAGVLTVTKATPVIEPLPAAISSLTYTGLEQDLITAGTTSGGTLTYAVTTENTAPTNADSWSDAVPKAKDAGTYNVYYKVVGNNDYEDVAVTDPISVTISPAPLTITANAKSITYGDSPANNNDNVAYSGFVNNESENSAGFTGALNYEYSYIQYGDVSNGTNTYTITPTGLTSNNYSITYVAGTLTVNPKEVGLNWSTEAITYNAQNQAPTATATGTVNGDEINVTVTVVEDPHANAGEYTATASALTGNKAGNYVLPSESTHTFRISKAAALTLQKDLNQFYTVTSFNVSVADMMPVDAGTVTYAANGDAGTAGSVTVSGFTVSDTGDVTATLANGAVGNTVTLPVKFGSTNYEDSTGNVVITLTEKGDADVIVNDLEKTYGDEEFTLTGTVTYPGTGEAWSWTIDNAEVASVGTTTGQVKIKKAGTATFTANYTSDTTEGTGTFTLTVKPKPVTLTWDAAGLTYSGTEQAPTATITYGVVSGDTVDVSVVKEHKDVGSYTATATLGNSNYVIDPSTAEYVFSIDPAPLTVTTGSGSKTYDGTPLNNDSVTLEGLQNNETATVTATGSITDVGSGSNTYTITYNTADSKNYTVTENLGTLTVTANDSAVTLTAPSASKTYDGTPLTGSGSVTFSGLPDDFTVEATFEGSQTYAGNSKNVIATYVIRNADGDDKTDRFTAVATVDGTLTVDRRKITLTYLAASKTYDGTAAAELDAETVQMEGVMDGDEVTLSGDAEFIDSVNAGATKPVLFNNLVLGGEQAGNYELAMTTVLGTGSISAKELTLTWDDKDTFNYDSEAHAPTATISGVVDGDPCTVVVTGEQTSVGSYTATAVLQNNDLNNYMLPAEHTKTFTIKELSKEDLKTAIDEAKDYYDEIKDENPTIADELKKKIEDAEDVYNNENVTGDEIENAIDDLKKAKNDAGKAKDVEDQINDLKDPDDVTLDDKDDIEEALEAYEDLTDDQKDLIDEDKLKKLTDDEDKLNELQQEKDQSNEEAVKVVEDLIDNLPDPKKVKIGDRKAIEAARKAYNKLTDDQKKLVDKDKQKKLTDDEKALKQAQEEADSITKDRLAAQAVTDQINALPDPENVTLEDQEAIEAARKAYDNLTDYQKKFISSDTLNKQKNDEKALKDLQDAAKKAAQDQQAAKAVIDMINALPDPENVTLDDQEAIEAARKAYKALTEDQQKLIDAETLQKLTDDEAALAALLAAAEKDTEDQNAAQAVVDMINALPDPENVTLDDQDIIEAAWKAYKTLTEDQQKLIDAETLQKLTEDDAALAALLAAAEKDAEDQKAAQTVAGMIDALPSAKDVTTDDQEAIEQTVDAYGALTVDQKKRIDADRMQKLTDDVKALAKLLDQKKKEDFITRCYWIFLEREPDEGGLEAWSRRMESGELSAIEVMQGFVFGDEFMAKNLNLQQQISTVGKMMNSNETDMASWNGERGENTSLANVINGLGASNEFDRLRVEYGIGDDYGNDNGKRINIQEVRAFVARCYEVFLKRQADDAGMNAWAERMASGELGLAEVVYGFVTGDEFPNVGMSNEELMDAVYEVLLNREPNAEEKATWVTMLDQGEPVSTVINRICKQDEFKQTNGKMGVRAGKAKPGILPGDVNADGIVDGKDAILLMNYLAGEIDPETGKEYEIDEKAADLNGDGEINEVDLLRLMKMMAED